MKTQRLIAAPRFDLRLQSGEHPTLAPVDGGLRETIACADSRNPWLRRALPLSHFLEKHQIIRYPALGYHFVRIPS